MDPSLKVMPNDFIRTRLRPISATIAHCPTCGEKVDFQSVYRRNGSGGILGNVNYVSHFQNVSDSLQTVSAGYSHEFTWIFNSGGVLEIVWMLSLGGILDLVWMFISPNNFEY